MMKLFSVIFFVIAAVAVGLVIAYWYLRRVEDERRGLRKEPRVEPMPDKHPPVDLTPGTPELLDHRDETTGTPDGADVDGLMRRLAAIKAEQEPRQAPERDDLKRIKGVGPKMEQLLNANGIFHFQQIADWQDADVQEIDKRLPAFHGRIRRENWVGQSQILCKRETVTDGPPPA